MNNPAGNRERDRLWTQYQPLINATVNRYAAGQDDRDDLRGELYVEFTKLLVEYDPARGIPLHGYLCKKVRWAAFVSRRRTYLRRDREPSLDVRLEIGGEDPTREWDRALALAEWVAALPAAIASLPRSYRVAVTLRCLQELPYAEIAAREGYQAATAERYVHHAIKKLRVRMLPEAGG